MRLVTGDTDVTVVGGGAHSARASARRGGHGEGVGPDRGRQIAAWMLEAAAADIEISARRFRVRGTARSVDPYAIVDALAELGVEHIELPATPERVWQAMGRRWNSAVPTC